MASGSIHGIGSSPVPSASWVNMVGSARVDRSASLPRGVIAAALIAALVVSARLTVAAAVSHEHAWVGFVSLLPLFVAIRVCRPIVALAFGALWGLSVFGFGVVTPGSGVAGSILVCSLLTATPGLYAFGGAWLTRRIGFSPFVLGVGWMFVELAVAPLGPQDGLLAGTQGDGVLMHWVGRAMGHVLVAFLVAYVSASLVTALSKVRIRVPSSRRVVAAGERIIRLTTATFSHLISFSISACRPRAPPA